MITILPIRIDALGVCEEAMRRIQAMFFREEYYPATCGRGNEDILPFLENARGRGMCGLHPTPTEGRQPLGSAYPSGALKLPR